MNLEKFQDKQMELFEEYIQELEAWYEDGYDLRFKRMNEIKEIIENIAIGMQFSVGLEQMALQKSGLVIPQPSVKSKITR